MVASQSRPHMSSLAMTPQHQLETACSPHPTLSSCQCAPQKGLVERAHDAINETAVGHEVQFCGVFPGIELIK